MEHNTDEHLQVAVVLGSTREGRFGHVVANWVVRQFGERPDMIGDLIDLAVTPIPSVLPAFGQPSSDPAALDKLAAVTPRLATADAFVVVTPEYNHSYPAALKQLVDWHNKEWYAKPVAFVSYGGISGGLRAVEHMRGVMAEVHAVTLRETVSFAMAWTQFDAEGNAVSSEADAAAKKMLDHLAWWGTALRRARNDVPYPA